MNTAPNGAGLASGLPTVHQWADIINANAAALPGGDTLQFTTGVQFTTNLGNFGTIDAGVAATLALSTTNTAGVFNVAGNTYVFDHTTASHVSVAPTDALVEFVGIVFNAAFTVIGPNGTGIVHLA